MPRLDRLLARTLGLSRKQSTRLCRAGRVVAEDGAALRDPAHPLPPSRLPITVRVDARPVTLRARYHLLQHKPRGVVTALRDRRHRTAFDLLAQAREEVPLLRDLRAVGRLDLDTSGLLLWTTEGPLLHRITHPRYAVPRVYHVALARPWSPLPPDLTLEDGSRPRVQALAPLERAAAHPALHVPDEAAALATITLTSGMFHEVRRVFAALDSHVLGLCRVAYGSVTLPRELAPGEHRELDLHAEFANLHPASDESSSSSASKSSSSSSSSSS
ncbi:MAG: rRNA pseudouridine synthase, partial [Myxococcales bacterium]|nr:rRNA pseudouridine synthase [Myxococcales bacterium]